MQARKDDKVKQTWKAFHAQIFSTFEKFWCMKVTVINFGSGTLSSLSPDSSSLLPYDESSEGLESRERREKSQY